jgi:hypothetical protein
MVEVFEHHRQSSSFPVDEIGKEACWASSCQIDSVS